MAPIITKPLSAQQKKVLALSASGYRGKDVARILDITHGRVRNILSEIYSKLGVHSLIQAILRARQLGELADCIEGLVE